MPLKGYWRSINGSQWAYSVEDYFANLDVQEEINKQSRSMAEAGLCKRLSRNSFNNTLLSSINVAEMKAGTNYVAGSATKLLVIW